MLHDWQSLLLLLVSVLGYLLTLLLIPSLLLNKRKSSVSVVAWCMTIVLMPLIGSLFYLLFGINRVDRRTRSRQLSVERIGMRLPEWSQYDLLPGEENNPQHHCLAELGFQTSGNRPMQGNTVEIYAETSVTLQAIEDAVNQAQQTIHLEYYIWQPDETGRRLRDMLIKKAKQGVKVRFLVDSLGSMRLKQVFLQPMREAGIEVATFLPGQSLRERWSVNLRSHRKIVVVDGQIGFTGGMNIGDEYLGRDPYLGYWRDTHLRLTGPSVLQLQQVFVEDWYFATGVELLTPEFFPEPAELGDRTLQVIPGGPDQEQETFHTLYFSAINEAQARLCLATSYFVPTPALVMALETAALRGVRVRILLPQKSAHWLMVVSGRSYYESLLESGVEIYEYTGGLLHSKTITIDGNWSLVGSPNFDARSVQLNFEIGVAIFEPSLALILEEQFERDCTTAVRINLEQWRKRPLLHQLGEGFCRLFSPVL